MKKLLLLLSVILFACSEDEPTKNTNDEKRIETKYCNDLADMPDGLEGTYVRIVGLLPNPAGEDDYNEMFAVRSFKDSTENISSYYILDDEKTRWDLDELEFVVESNGASENCKTYNYTSDKVAQLLNGGDVVYLYNSNDILIQTVEYLDTKDGEWIYP